MTAATTCRCPRPVPAPTGTRKSCSDSPRLHSPIVGRRGKRSLNDARGSASKASSPPSAESYAIREAMAAAERRPLMSWSSTKS